MRRGTIARGPPARDAWRETGASYRAPPVSDPTPTTKPALARNVVVLGVVSLLTDVGSEMVFPLLPVFLVGTLGGGALTLAWIEGLADAVAAVMRFWAGRWSDRTGRCRPFVIAGYAIATVMRPLTALAQAPWHVGAVRAVDRIGKGLRSTPRDALLASSVPPERRAAAFGFHRSMDHLGAAIGPLVAFVLLQFATDDVRIVFWCAAIPGVAAVLVAWWFVRELPSDVVRVAKPKRESGPGSLRAFLVPFAVFVLGAAGDEFLLLRLGASRDSWAALPLLWMALHIVRAAFAAPCGRLADRIGARRVLTFGWFGHAAVFCGFALVDGQAGLVALFLLHGARTAFTEGAERALVAELAPAGTRGTAFAWYYLVLGLAPRVLFGGVWDAFGDDAAFAVAAGLATLAAAALAVRRT